MPPSYFDHVDDVAHAIVVTPADIRHAKGSIEAAAVMVVLSRWVISRMPTQAIDADVMFRFTRDEALRNFGLTPEQLAHAITGLALLDSAPTAVEYTRDGDFIRFRVPASAFGGAR